MAFAAGAATLLVELFLIRYLPGQIRVLGYFTNFVLLACFLGLGAGMLAHARPGAHRWPALAPHCLLALIALAELGRGARVVPTSAQFLFLEYAFSSRAIPLFPFLAISFCLIAAAMAPLGAAVAASLEGPNPLRRYGHNLLGSLAGVALFSALSGLGAPPWAWALAAAAAGAAVGVAGRARGVILAGALSALATAALAQRGAAGAVWSPYQRITLGPIRLLPGSGVVPEWLVGLLSPEEASRLVTLGFNEGFTLRVNDDSYQTPLDLSDGALKRHPELAAVRLQYDLPFLSGKKGRSVLVLGAGTGNDAAGALRNGAVSVTAVEIDPEILALGRLHPERPYQDRRVTTLLDDARRFLSRTENTYDIIIFGLLDSHVLMSSRSGVRLDSFVFTRESFALARRRLKPGGFVLVSHAVGAPWFFERMKSTLADAFGRPPLILTGKVPHAAGIVYAAGDAVRAGESAAAGFGVMEDDWPFPYLPARRIPHDYLAAMTLMLLAGLAGVAAAAPKGAGAVDAPMAALGAGFMLVETRGLTALSVLAGSTWASGAAIFSGVLVMAWLSTLAAPRLKRFGSRPVFVVLGGLLLLDYFLPIGALAALPSALGVALGALVLSAPLFAGGVIFAQWLEKRKSAGGAVAANLLGALAGGLLENFSMVTGLRALVLIAGALYAFAFAMESRRS